MWGRLHIDTGRPSYHEQWLASYQKGSTFFGLFGLCCITALLSYLDDIQKCEKWVGEVFIWGSNFLFRGVILLLKNLGSPLLGFETLHNLHHVSHLLYKSKSGLWIIFGLCMISLAPVYDDVVFVLETQSTQVKKCWTPPLALFSYASSSTLHPRQWVSEWVSE